MAAVLMTGCARFGTTQTDESYDTETGTKRVRTITTRASAYTLFSARSSLAKWKASQTDKTQGATVGDLNQESSATNETATIERIVSAAVGAAVKAK